MTKTLLVMLALVLLPACAFAIDGQGLINQSTVMAAGGFPYVISNPGSYKLSGNLNVTTSVGSAIRVMANNVTLDLDGFQIACTMACSGSVAVGIDAGFTFATPTFSNLAVKNGTVQGFQFGVFIRWDASVTDLFVSGNLLDGITMGNGGVIARCVANSNGGAGINVDNATVSDSRADGNKTYGFEAFQSTLIHNSASNNAVFQLNANQSIYGSNIFVTGSGASVTATANSLSQGNNLCNSGAC